MTNHLGDREFVEQIAEDFVERYRNGENPAVETYADRYPEHAQEIRELFPALIMLERSSRRSSYLSYESSGVMSDDGRMLRTLGDYLILREIGKGGMGVVYEAEHQHLGRRVALKALLPHASRDRFLERFQVEARSTARLHHRHIVPVYEAGEHDGVHFIAMQFIEGRSLDKVLSDLRTDSSADYYRNVARLGIQAAEAISYAHSQHVLHRDIKPSNLLLDHHEDLWITDFGLAKMQEENLTLSGDIVGTLRYMAPERFHGQCDGKSDIYGLGMTLYEMLTFRPAFTESDRGSLIRQVTEEDPPRPRRINRAIPADLETIVLKATAKNPADRYHSAAALAEDLRCFLGHLPIQARNWSLTHRTMRWCRRRPAIALLTALAAALLVTTSFTSVWLANALHKSQLHLKRATEAERNAMQTSFDAAVAEAQARRMTGRVGQRFDSLKAISRAASLADKLQLEAEKTLQLRNQAIASMALPDVRVLESWNAMGRQVAAVDADFEHYFQHVAADPGVISVGRIDDLQELFRLPGFGLPAWMLRPSPDGRLLAAKYHDPQKRDLHLYVWDLHARKPVLKLKDGVYYDGWDFSPDCRSIVIGPRDGSVRRYDLTTGQQTQSLAPAPSGYPAYAIRFQPGGKKLAVSSLEQRTIEIRDPQSSEVLTSYICPSGVRRICWNRDGRLLAAGCDDRHIYVWDVDEPTTSPRLKLAGHHSSVIDVAFNDRGDILASYSWDETTRLWSIGTGRQVLTAPGRIVRFSPDDRRAYFHRPSENGIWDVDFSSRRTLAGYAPAGEIRHVGIGPRGHLLATATTSGVQIWDLSTGREVAFLPIGDTLAVVFHPDGHKLLTSGPLDGLFEWPVVSIPNPTESGARPPNAVKVGPPRKLLAARHAGRASLDPGGRKIVVSRSINITDASAVVLDLHQRAEHVVIEGQPQLETVAISPDAKWVATGTWKGTGVKIWHADTGRLAQELPSEGDSRVLFSPDGKWLVTSTAEEYQIWRVGTWQSNYRLHSGSTARTSGPMAFTDDGKILAVALPPRLIRLVEVETGRELATLEPPSLENLVELCFSRDGSRLVWLRRFVMFTSGICGTSAVNSHRSGSIGKLRRFQMPAKNLRRYR